MNKRSPNQSGFSLLELIVVILIIGIIAAFAVPATSTMLKGSQLTQAAQIVTDQFSLARQEALTKNRTIEIRLIRYADVEVPGEASNGTPNLAKGQYRAIQVFERLDSGAAVPLDKPQLLPQSIVISPGSLSSLISRAGASSPRKLTPVANDPELPRNVKKNYDYVNFYYLPDGSTDLPSTNNTTDIWYLTLHNLNETPAGATPPKNFFTLQVNPLSGVTKFYRPGLKDPGT